MDKHTHRWGVVDSWPDRDEKLHAECFWGWKASDWKQQCSATLDDDEIDRRLNATQRLSAEDATIAASDVHWRHGETNETSDSLRAYAAALEED